MEQYYLELCNDPIRFDSVSQITDVFFDDSNKQVLQSLSILFKCHHKLQLEML